MPESRLASIATSPLVTEFAVDRSQKALKPSGRFVAPLCPVADITFHYKIYDALARFTVPDTKRQPGGRVTRLGFGGIDKYARLEPNALDLPIPNILGLSDQALQWQIMEGMGILADASALALEVEQLNLATSSAGKNWEIDWTEASDGTSANDPIGDPNYGLDQAVRNIMLAAPGMSVRILFGNAAALAFRQNTNVRSRFVVGTGGGDGNVGLVSPNINQFSSLIFGNPQCQQSDMVVNTAPAGTVAPGSSTAGMAAQLGFIMDNEVLVFAASDTPNRMDASYMKTFSPIEGFFKPGTYMNERNDTEIAKMDWTTLPLVTNAPAGILITTIG